MDIAPLRVRVEKTRDDAIEEALKAVNSLAAKAAAAGALHSGRHLIQANEAMVEVAARRFREVSSFLERLPQYDFGERKRLLSDTMIGIRNALVEHHHAKSAGSRAFGDDKVFRQMIEKLGEAMDREIPAIIFDFEHDSLQSDTAGGHAAPSKLARGLDLYRELLLRLDRLAKPGGTFSFSAHDEDIAIAGYSADEIDETLEAVFDEEFALGATDGMAFTQSGTWLFRRLTPSGREFLDAVRDEDAWLSIRSAAERTGARTLGSLRTIASEDLRRRLKGVDPENREAAATAKALFNTRRLEIFIASPSDVTEERKIVREIVNDWNNVHSRQRQIILVPVGWDTHSGPDLSDRAQAIINDGVLEHADILVGIFRTRLGTPTKYAASGTIEEIQLHRERGKHVMLYFYSGTIPQSTDHNEFQKLKEFKAWVMDQGMIEQYASLDEFRDRLSRQLGSELTRDRYMPGAVAVPLKAQPPRRESSTQNGLSSDAMQLLRAMERDEDGSLSIRKHLGGVSIGTRQDRILDGNPGQREIARWEAAIAELSNRDLIRDPNGGGYIFRLTDAGYRLTGSIFSPRW